MATAFDVVADGVEVSRGFPSPADVEPATGAGAVAAGATGCVVLATGCADATGLVVRVGALEAEVVDVAAGGVFDSVGVAAAGVFPADVCGATAGWAGPAVVRADVLEAAADDAGVAAAGGPVDVPLEVEVLPVADVDTVWAFDFAPAEVVELAGAGAAAGAVARAVAGAAACVAAV